ncbi:hypothetical protein [uncultured Bacteroides sp.]|uniref:hypothetical protein n=1 Tax=uncultured Bacteroides sp. TaxID=162156 RepID=UPI002AA7F380|nr:hypothetical protein [uncultured Bacteroides sp.]
MKIIDGIINILQVLLPFLKKKDAKQVQEFTDLVKSQFDYLMEQITGLKRTTLNYPRRCARCIRR